MIAFFLAIPHSEAHILWEALCKYTPDPNQLVLATETSKKSHRDISGQHFHVFAEWDDLTYNAFKRTVMINKYKLRGQSKDDLARQFGRVRDIRDHDRMIAYTIKDKNYKYKNIDEEFIKYAETISFKKEDRKTNVELCLEYLTMINKPHLPDFKNQDTLAIYKFEELVLEYWIENIKEKVIAKTTLHHIIVRYLTQEYPYYKKHIYEILQYIKKNT